MGLLKPETTARLQTQVGKIGRVVKRWAIPALVGATGAAAWSGHKRSVQLEKRMNRAEYVIDNNADVQIYHGKVIAELQRQQNVLLEKALVETEGKKAE